MKKLSRNVLLSAASIPLLLSINANPTYAATAEQICDNDPISTAQYCSSPSSPANWDYVSGRSSSYNGDHRFHPGTNFDTSSYSWRIFTVGSYKYPYHFYVYAWINSASFTGKADYWMKDESQTNSTAESLVIAFNQYTAPGGWNGVGYNNMNHSYQPTVGVKPFLHTDNIGADAIKLNWTTTDGLTTMDTGSVETKVDISSGIREKMLNAIDNYDYIKGKFTYDMQSNYQVDFEIEQDSTPGSNVTIKSPTGKIIAESVANEKEIVNFDYNDNSYVNLTKNPDKFKIMGPRVIKSKGPKNEDARTYLYRNDPASSGVASDVVFPQQYAFWLDDETQNYRIVGSTKFLERDGTIIQGTLSPSLAERLKSDSFEMIVDTKTGVLLRVTTSSKGQIINKIEVHDISFDKTNKEINRFDTANKKGFTKKELK